MLEPLEERLVPSTFKFLDTQLQVNEDSAYAVGTILRLDGTSGSASVEVYSNTEGGNIATEDVDYTAIWETLAFADGESQKTFQVPILDDSTYERPENLALYLTNASSGNNIDITAAYANLEIVDPEDDTPPLVADDGPWSVAHGETYWGSALSNDSDADADDLSGAVVSQPAHGSVYYDSGMQQFVVTASSTYVGPDFFTYRAHDGVAFSTATATVYLNITGTAPTGGSLSFNYVAENSSTGTLVGTLSGSDPDTGDTLTFSLINSAGGRFQISGTELQVDNGSLLDFESTVSHDITVRITDQCGLYYDQALTISLWDANDPATDLSLSPASVAENYFPASVGDFSTTDPDATDSFTYTLVSGTGDTDNSFFTISGNTLGIPSPADYETKSSYSIRVRSTDSGGQSVEKVFTITVNDVNEEPTDISLSASTVQENAASGTTVGTLSASDPDADDTRTYALLDDAGGRFLVVGTELRVASGAVLDYETQTTHSIWVQVMDTAGASRQQWFTLTITDVNEAPPHLELWGNTVVENVTTGTVVGILSASDPDGSSSFTFTLVSGTGDSDNAAFVIAGSELRTTAGFDYETQSACSIRVQVSDAGGLSYQKAFTIAILDANDAPTDLAFSGNTVPENEPLGTLVGSFSTTDPDSADSHYYGLVSGVGDTDNTFFWVMGDQLYTADALDFETQSVYSIRVRTTDMGGWYFERMFIITVTDANDAPTDLSLSANTIAENSPTGTVIGSFTVTDPDLDDSHALQLLDDADGRFEVVENELRVASGALLDFETATSHTITVRVTDAGGLNFDKAFTITVTDVNDPLVITVPEPFTVPEDTDLSVVSLAFSDEDAGNGDYELILSVAQGWLTLREDVPNGLTAAQIADNGTSEVVLTGSLTAINATLAEATGLVYCGDLDFHGQDWLLVYVAELDSAGSGGLTYSGALIDITVTPVNDAPLLIELLGGDIDEGQWVVGTLFTLDPDDDSFTYSLVGAAEYPNNELFAIAGEDLVVAGGATLEAGMYTVQVQATDSAGVPVTQTFMINVAAAIVPEEDNTEAPEEPWPLICIAGETTVIDLSFDAAPSAVLQVVLNVAQGTLNATASGDVVLSGVGSAELTLIGTAGDVNATLASVAYTPESAYEGPDQLHIAVDAVDPAEPEVTFSDATTIHIVVLASEPAPGGSFEVAGSPTTGSPDTEDPDRNEPAGPGAGNSTASPSAVDLWRDQFSPFFANSLLEARARAWAMAPNGATGDGPVGEEVAVEFGVDPETAWRDFFPAEEWQALEILQTEAAAALDPVLLVHLDADWREAVAQDGYADYVGVGELVAARWRAAPGFGWVQPETSWQELYTYPAYQRLQQLRASPIPSPLLRIENGVGYVLTATASPVVMLRSLNAVQGAGSSRRETMLGLLRSQLLPRLRVATPAELAAYVQGLNADGRVTLRFALDLELARLASPTASGTEASQAERTLFQQLYSELHHVGDQTNYGAHAANAGIGDVLAGLNPTDPLAAPRLSDYNRGSHAQRLAFLADTDYELFRVREQGTSLTAEEYYGARAQLIQVIEQALISGTSVSAAVQPLFEPYYERPVVRYVNHMVPGFSHTEVVVVTPGIPNPYAGAARLLFNTYLRGADAAVPDAEYHATDRYSQNLLGLSLLPSWRGASEAERASFADHLGGVDRAALLNSLALAAIMAQGTGEGLDAQTALAMAAFIQRRFNEQMSSVNGPQPNAAWQAAYLAVAQADPGWIILNGIPAAHRSAFEQMPVAVRILALEQATESFRAFRRSNPVAVRYNAAMGLEFVDRLVLNAAEFLAPVYRTGQRVWGLVSGDYRDRFANLDGLRQVMEGNPSADIGLQQLHWDLWAVWDGALTLMTVLPFGAGNRAFISGGSYLPTSVNFAARQALSGGRHVAVMGGSGLSAILAMSSVEVSPLPESLRGTMRFVVGIGVGLSGGMLLHNRLPQLNFRLTAATAELEGLLGQASALQRQMAAGGATEALTARLAQVNAAATRVRTQVDHLRGLGGAALGEAEAAVQAAQAEVQQALRGSGSAGRAPSWYARLRGSPQLRQGQHNLRQAEERLAGVLEEIEQQVIRQTTRTARVALSAVGPSYTPDPEYTRLAVQALRQYMRAHPVPPGPRPPYWSIPGLSERLEKLRIMGTPEALLERSLLRRGLLDPSAPSLIIPSREGVLMLLDHQSTPISRWVAQEIRSGRLEVELLEEVISGGRRVAGLYGRVPGTAQIATTVERGSSQYLADLYDVLDAVMHEARHHYEVTVLRRAFNTQWEEFRAFRWGADGFDWTAPIVGARLRARATDADIWAIIRDPRYRYHTLPLGDPTIPLPPP